MFRWRFQSNCFKETHQTLKEPRENTYYSNRDLTEIWKQLKNKSNRKSLTEKYTKQN